MKLEDPRLEQLLADYRAERRPGGLAKRRMWKQLEAERRRRSWSRAALAGAVALAALVLLWLGMQTWSGSPQSLEHTGSGQQAPFQRQGSGTQQAVPRSPPANARPKATPAPVQDTTNEPPALEQPQKAPTRSVTPRSPTTPEPAQPTQAASTAPERPSELELIEAAEAALRRGELSKALATLDEHAERFASSNTEEERRALRVLVLCRLGRTAEGRGARWAFLRDYPRSTYHQRITKACPQP